MREQTPRKTRHILFGIAVGVALGLLSAALSTKRPENRQLVLVYYEAYPSPPPNVPHVAQPYPSLSQGNPAKHWYGREGPYLAALFFHCGVRQFNFRRYNGLDLGWSGAAAKEVATVPLATLTTREANCVTQIVKPPHVLIAFPDIDHLKGVISQMVQYNPPYG